MRRRLFNLGVGGAAALSLVLSVATAVAWVRGYYASDQFIFFGRYRFLVEAEVGQGAFGLRLWTCLNPALKTSRIQYYRGDRPNPIEPSSLPSAGGSMSLGYFYADMTPQGFFVERLLRVPYWFAVPVTAALPTLWVRTRLRSRLGPHKGVCRTCGYDLRATPDRCPECGAEAKPRATEGATA